jgi:hypothetical protein
VGTLLLLIFLGGGVPVAPSWAAKRLQPIAEEELLDIGIRVFDPGIDRPSFQFSGFEQVNADVRRAEAAYMAVQLMQTLQKTGRFGFVRMVPEGSVTVDLMITGRIHQSSGRRLALEFEVTDATGKRWLRRGYLQHADPYSYRGGFDADIEPYQELYDQFAADLVRAQTKKKKRLAEVRQIAELRFASQLAPAVFGDYLRTKRRGRYVLQRLPALDDPMLARIRKIRTRDEFFLDLLTERYQDYYAEMDRVYDDYRASSFEGEMALRYARVQAYLANIQAVTGPRGGFRPRSPFPSQREQYFRRQAVLQARYLDDMARSFAMVIEPLRLELDGEVIRFEGTIEDQYRQWQALLEEIFETETGLSIAGQSDPTEPARDSRF